MAGIAGVLRVRGVEVRILDAAVEHLDPIAVVRRARGFDRVVISSCTLDKCCRTEVDARLFLETARALAEPAP